MDTVELRIAVTPEQLQILNDAERATQAAIAQTNLILATIMAGVGVRGTFKGIELGEPSHLVVLVPGEPPPA